MAGNDFYSAPRLSPDGNRLAYLTWSHPNMPWDGCELWLSEIGPDGALTSSRLIAGSKTEFHLPASMVTGWDLALCGGEHRLVESVSLDGHWGRAALAHAG